MIRRHRRIALLAALVGASVGVAVAAPAASAETLPLTYDLGIVLPGTTASVERELTVPVRSVVTAATFDAPDTDAVWTADLCTAAGVCAPIADLDGTTLDAGDYHLVIAVAMSEGADGATSVASSGLLTLVQSATTGGLPATGGTIPFSAAVIGATFAVGGALLLRAGRRRRDREEETA